MLLCLKLSVVTLGVSVMLLKFLSSNKKQKSILKSAIVLELVLALNLDWFLLLVSYATITVFTNKYLVTYKNKYARLKVAEDLIKLQETPTVTKDEFIEQILNSKIS